MNRYSSEGPARVPNYVLYQIAREGAVGFGTVKLYALGYHTYEWAKRRIEAAMERLGYHF